MSLRLMEKKSKYVYIKKFIYIYIVANSRPPACERPRNSNRNRVAHWTDNSVVTLLGLPPGTSHGWGFNLTTVVPIVYPRKIGSFAEFDLPK